VDHSAGLDVEKILDPKEIHNKNTSTLITKSLDSSVGVALGYGLDGWGSIPGSSHSVQTGSEAHPASYPIGTGANFPEVKVAGA
jgi:hypothetical protein